MLFLLFMLISSEHMLFFVQKDMLNMRTLLMSWFFTYGCLCSSVILMQWFLTCEHYGHNLSEMHISNAYVQVVLMLWFLRYGHYGNSMTGMHLMFFLCIMHLMIKSLLIEHNKNKIEYLAYAYGESGILIRDFMHMSFGLLFMYINYYPYEISLKCLAFQIELCF